jgi:hypothetical protein
MGSNNNDRGVRERITAAVLEATDEQSLREIRQRLKDEGLKEGSINAVISELKKKGLLKFGGGSGDFYPVKIGKSEIIPPEQALSHIRLQDGDYKLGFIDGMSTLIMAARYNQLLAASQAEVLSNQLRIMEEGRRGSIEVAQAVASELAQAVQASNQEILGAIKSSAIAQSRNPMQAMVINAMEPLFRQLLTQVMSSFIRPVPQGQPGQPGQQLSGTPQQPPTVPGASEMTIEEEKEVFG